MLVFLAENVAGDPDTWPEAAVWIVGIIAAAFCFWVWRQTRDDDE